MLGSLLRKRTSWFIGALALVFLIGAACGGDDATPVPQPTVDVDAITQALKGTIDEAIKGIDIPEGLTADDVSQLVNTAIAGIDIPEGLKAADVQAIVAKAIGAIPEGLTAARMEAAIKAAVDSGVKEAVASAVAQIPPTSTPLPAMFGGVSPFGGVIPMLAYDSPNPHFIYGGVSYKSQVHLKPTFNMILDWNHETPDKLDWLGDLASDWSVSADGVTWTFKVNPDAKWHDGVDVTADDLITTIDIWRTGREAIKALHPSFADLSESLSGEGQSAFDSIKQHIVSHDKIDDDTISLTLTDPPSGVFINHMLNQQLMVLPKHILEKGILPGNPAEKASMIGSGPFKFVEYTTDVSSVLEKNPDYFKEGKPRLNGIENFIITSASGRAAAAFETEQVLMANSYQASLNANALIQLEKTTFGKVRLFWQGPLYAYSIHFNTRVAPFNDQKVRKGFQLGIHRQPYLEIVTANRGGQGTPLPDGFPWSYTRAESDQFPGFRESSAGVKDQRDIDATKALFEDAGFGEGTEVTLTCSTSLAYCDVGQVIKGQFLKDYGWTINIDAVRGDVAREKYATGNFELNIQATGFSFPHPAAALRSQTSVRNAGWTGVSDADNPQYPLFLRLKEIQEEMLFASDQSAPRVLQVMQEAHDLQMEDPYIIPMLYVTQAWPVNQRIKGFNPPPVVTAGNTHEHIWCNPDCP